MTTPTSQDTRHLALERRVILCLATLLVVNPVILFLLTANPVAALLITLASVLLLQATFSRPTLKILTAYLFNALVVLSLFAHAEIILLHAYPDYVIQNLYTVEDGYYFNRPFLDERFVDKEYAATYRTNAQGLRIGEGHDPARTVERADWLVLGDSFTQGAQVEFEELFTSLLNARFPDKVIINAGISGSGIGHEYNYFTDEGYRYEPSLVILQLGSFNDFMNVEPGRVGFTDRLMAHSAFIRFLLTDLRYQNPTELPLGRWTEPFYPDHRSNIDYNVFYTESSPYKQQDLAAFRRYVELLNETVTAKGAALLITLIPTKEQVCVRNTPCDLSYRSDVDINHVHGFLPQEWDERRSRGALVLSAKSYRERRAEIDKGWSQQIATRLQSHIGLFLGLSGDDGSLLDIVKRAGKEIRRAED